MFKVIVERPRLVHGGSGNSDDPKGHRRRLARIPLDEQPRFESSARRRRYGWYAKNLNENLAPLRRYLRRQVGRPWDKVHSEICEHLSPDSAVKSHVLDHVRQEVATDVVMVGRVPHHGPGGRFRRGPLDDCLYVHPRTGLLRLAPRLPRKPPARPAFTPHPTDPMLQFHRLGGAWFEVRLAVLTVSAWDVVLRRCVSPSAWDDGRTLHVAYGRRDLYAAAKRQLGRREIRSLGLVAAS